MVPQTTTQNTCPVHQLQQQFYMFKYRSLINMPKEQYISVVAVIKVWVLPTKKKLQGAYWVFSHFLVCVVVYKEH